MKFYLEKQQLSPLYQVVDTTLGGSIRTEIPFEHTKHRYPWICSLRSKELGRPHQCGVTLLRKPPGPIVLVTAAHCTILCKSSDNQIRPNCCCENVRGECTNNEECGDNPKVVEMTGEDAEVVCGDWEIGNIAFPSKNIITYKKKLFLVKNQLF